MVKVYETPQGQKRITLRDAICEALDIKGGDEVAIIFRDDLKLWEFIKK